MRREVYDQPKNEIEQQQLLHHLDKDMAQDYEQSTRVLTREDNQSYPAEGRGLILFLVLVFVCFGLTVWLY